MATIDELNKKYREMFPEAAGAPTTDLDTEYKRLFGSEEKEKKEKPLSDILYKGQIGEWMKPFQPDTGYSGVWKEGYIPLKKPEKVEDLQEEPLWRKAAKLALPKKAEEFLGLDKPMPEKTPQQKAEELEKAKRVYDRGQKFEKKLQEALLADPKDFEIPEGYKEPGAFGQLIEGIEAGWRSTVMPSIGYFTESMGKVLDAPAVTQWGMEMGDIMMIDFLRRPELMRPEDLKPFLDGGWTDLRSYGRTIGEVIPFMVTLISLSTVGGIIGGPAGAFTGGFTAGAAIEQGNAYKAMLDAGVDPDKAAPASVAYGAIASIIENLIGFKPGQIATNLLRPTRIATESFKSYLLKELPKMGIEGLKKSIAEGGEEVAQQLAEDLLAKWAGSEEGISTLKELGEQFVAGTVGSIPFGVSEIRLPSITKISEITKPITPADVKAEVKKEPVVPKEEDKLVEVEKNIKQYLKDGMSYEGDIQPLNPSLIKLNELSKESVVIKDVQEKIQKIIDSGEIKLGDDGKITLWRAGKVDLKREGLVSASYTKEAVELFREGMLALRQREKGLELPITEFKVDLGDIKIFRGGKEKEVLVLNEMVVPKEKITVSKELESLAEAVKEYKDVEEFVSSTIFEKSLSGQESKALSVFKGKTTAEKLTDFYNQVAQKEKVKEIAKEVKPLAKDEFKVGDVLDPQGKTNMVGVITVSAVEGNTLKFTDSEGTAYSGMARATVRTLVKEGSWKRVEAKVEKPKTQKEIIKEAVKKEPKKVKEIAEETKILEPNIRRILGVGTKEGVFERVDKGVYVLRKDGKDVAVVYPGDALEILPKLVKDGFKADMVFLDIPYKTPAVKGGNRPMGYDFISPEQFKQVVENIKDIVRSEDSAVFYMYSQAKSGLKAMAKYNNVMTDAGFVPLARGEYTKLTKKGKPFGFPTPLGWKPLDPEGIIMFNLSGENIAEVPVDLDFKLTRPKGWKSEKPAEMLKDLIKLSTKEGETILDPFAGSGVAVAEAIRAGRKAVGIEIEKEAIEKHIKPKVEEAAKEIKPKAIPEPEVKEKMPKAHLTVKKLMEKSPTLPILNNFLVQKGKLTATDLEIGVRLNTDLKDGVYKIVGKEAVKSDALVEGFPLVPKVKGKLVGRILSENLANTLKAASLSIAKDNYMRPETSGVLLEIKNNVMTVASTDTFRLFRKTALLKGNNANVKIIVKAKKLQRILADMDSVIEIYDEVGTKGSVGMVHFRGKYGYITTRKIEGDFPAYEEIYPELNRRYILDRKQFLATLKELKPFVDKINKDITITYKDGKLELAAENKAEKISKKLTLNTSKEKIKKVNSKSPNDGVLIMEVKDDRTPQQERFRFNVNFLIDTMNALTEDRVFIYSPAEIAESPKLFSTEEELKSVKPKLKGAKNAMVGKFRDKTEVEMGHIEKIKPVEFPELVELARELIGSVPGIRKFRKSLGMFYAKDRGEIRLDPKIFLKGNESQLASTLAHEIGHLADYLPHKTLKRGNLIGSLLSLRKFLNSTYGTEGALDLAKIRKQARKEVLKEEKVAYKDITKEIKEKIKTRYNELITQTGAIKDAEIRAELRALSKYWRPFEESEVAASYITYRNSSRELYADAISVLFNTPGTLERLAPKFYKSFFENLDKKPEFKDAYFDLQELLSHDRATLIALRRKRTKEMFERADHKSEELQKIKEEERQLRLKDYWEKFTYGMRSINQPVYDKVKEAEARGEHIPDDINPKYLLSGRNYLAGQIKAEFEENIAPVMKDLGEHGIDWPAFGEFLLYERISEGDRSNFANPGGITPKDAKERIATLKNYYGENFSALQTNAAKFRGWLKSIGQSAYKEGLFSEKMFDLLEGNEKYVPFQVVEYMEDYVSWKSKAQIGTLKDISNPANSLILKAISTIRAIENQKNKMATFKLLENYFPKEIQEAKTQFTGRAQRPLPPKDRKLGLATYYKEGKLRGKYVDQYIAKSLEKDSISRNRAVMTILSPVSFLNQKLFRPLFVIYNPGWIPFNFIRDYMRFWKNTPDLSMLGAIKRYGQAFRAARVRAFGEKKDSAADAEARNLIRRLEKEKILSVTWNDMLGGQTTEDAQIEAVMQKLGLAESKKEIPAIYKPFEAIFKKMKLIPFIQGIRKMGDLVETLPKIAGYYELKEKMPPNQMREFIRKNIGSPDFFERGYLTPATNNIFLFSNAFIQAVSSDAWIATNPTTRSGFWFKTAKLNFVPKILMMAALMGAFGDELKKMYEDVSEYDMTNYYIIPLGRDTNNGKTVYLRIPMDETSRLLSALLWKTMRANSNDQAFGRDIADVVSLFGGQLPSISPAISAPISAMDFAAGRNPYDSFRGRLVLTEEQMKAGGMYALKPFLLWQFQQLGGNVFTKFYLGERTPTEKSAGEKFLQIPILSNIAGRFIKISDYGQLEKYRKKLQEIQGEKARVRIEENKVINEYVKKYQKKEGDLNELANDLILDILGHAISSKEEKRRADNIKKKFKISVKRGESDPKINALISAQTNEEKTTLMRVYKEIMSKEDFDKLKKELLQFKIISTNVLKELNRPFKP